jgi:O-antigen ligase
MMVTSTYADEKNLSIQMFFGLILLLYSYFILRLFIYQYSLNELIDQLFFIVKWFFIMSFVLYFIGIVAHYLFDVSLILEGDADNRAVLLGVYFENGVYPRLRGLCDSPNNFGMYAVLMLPVWISYSPRVKIWQFTIIALMIFLTMSITTFIAIACMFFIFLLIKFFNFNGQIRWKSVATILFYIMFFFVAGELISFVYLGGGNTDLPQMIDDRLSRAHTGSGRFDLWQYSWSLISEQPVFGYGLNQTRVLLASFRAVHSTHNNFLEIMIEGGFVGLLLYLFFLFTVIRAGISKALQKKERQWVVISLVGVFIFSNANVNLYADSMIFTLAIIATLPLLKNIESLDAPPPQRKQTN